VNIRITPRARADLAEIRDYVGERNQSGVIKLLRAIYITINFIAENPRAAEATDEPSIRVKIIVDYPYKIFYRLQGDSVEIIHIRHSARRPWIGRR
jgi:plasmid stabilization system protein ParE